MCCQKKMGCSTQTTVPIPEWTFFWEVLSCEGEGEVFLTSEAVDQGGPLLVFLFLGGGGAVRPVHFTDGRGAFTLNLRVELVVEQHLVHQIWLHGAGLGRGLGGPIVVTYSHAHAQTQANKPTKRKKRSVTLFVSVVQAEPSLGSGIVMFTAAFPRGLWQLLFQDRSLGGS